MTSWRRKRQDDERAGNPRHPRCKATRKVAFPTEAAAVARLDEMPVTGWHVYHCKFCGLWHTSSRGTGTHRRPG